MVPATYGALGDIRKALGGGEGSKAEEGSSSELHFERVWVIVDNEFDVNERNIQL